MSENGSSEGGIQPEPEFKRGLPPYSIPWQDRKAYPSTFGALWQTMKLVLFEPSRAFFNVQPSGSIGQALLYVIILSLSLIHI